METNAMEEKIVPGPRKLETENQIECKEELSNKNVSENSNLNSTCTNNLPSNSKMKRKSERNIQANKKIRYKDDNQPTCDSTSDTITINNLNNDCLIYIFQHLLNYERIKIERVCKRWQQISKMAWCDTKNFTLDKIENWGIEAFRDSKKLNFVTLRKILKRCGYYLNTINLSSRNHTLSKTKTVMSVIAKECPNLQKLDISGLELTVNVLQPLISNFENMTELKLGQSIQDYDNELSEVVKNKKKLKSIEVCSVLSRGKFIPYLSLDSIEKICLTSCSRIDKEYLLNSLPKFSNLIALEINNCSKIFDSVFTNAIGQCKNLKVLHLRKCNSNENVSIPENLISELKNLETLSITETDILKDNFIKLVKSCCKELKTLDISSCPNITNVGLKEIISLPKLENLYINKLINITDEPLGYVRNLKILECRKCNKIENAGLITLVESCKDLKILDISGCKSVDNGFIEAAFGKTSENKLIVYAKNTKIQIDNYVYRKFINEEGYKESLTLEKLNPVHQNSESESTDSDSDDSDDDSDDSSIFNDFFSLNYYDSDDSFIHYERGYRDYYHDEFDDDSDDDDSDSE